MNNFSTFTQEGARFMHTDRPDIFPTQQDAADRLSEWFSQLSAHDMEDDISPVAVASGGFELVRTSEEGHDEYTLSRTILSFNTFAPEGESYVFDWAQKGV